VTSIDTVTVDWHQTPGCIAVSRKLIIKKWRGWKAGKEEEGGEDEESDSVKWSNQKQQTFLQKEEGV